MIEFEKISKKFRNNFWDKEFHALKDVSFKIKQGDLIGFVGANGAGKTTLIKILMDFSRQDAGVVNFGDVLGKSVNEIRSNIGYLPERPYLYPYLTGREFLELVGSLNSIPKNKLHELIKEWSDFLQIEYAIDRKIKTYSKGMQQRLGFVCSVIHEPKFLVLDEPLSGLDPIGRRDFKKIMKKLNESGTTIFFSSHVVADVEELCNRVVFVEKGTLVYEGPIDELILKNSSDLYTLKYVLNSQIVIEHVREVDKDNKLKELMGNGIKILELEKEKPTLEEIIYKIKK